MRISATGSQEGLINPRLALASLLFIASIPIATAASASPATQPTPAAPHARVVRVIDGDTIEIETSVGLLNVRYIGIDTPESGFPLWHEAKAANRELVEGETVALVSDVSTTDPHGRLLRYVYLADPPGTFVNADLVRQGYARVLTVSPDVAHADEFLALEREARAAERGLWGYYGFPVYLPTLGHRGCVDLNTASLEELTLLDGIGVILAQQIIDGRPWSSIDELARVSGIGPSTIEKIKRQGLACVRLSASDKSISAS